MSTTIEQITSWIGPLTANPGGPNESSARYWLIISDNACY